MMCWIVIPSNCFKSVCSQNFLCTTFYQHSSIFRTTSMKYVQEPFLKEDLCALQVFLCVRVPRPRCAQLRGNIDCDAFSNLLGLVYRTISC